MAIKYKRKSIEQQMEDQKKKEEEFQKELARLIKQKDFKVEEDGSVIIYENPDPAITEEQKIEDEWPEWRMRYYERYLKEGVCDFCTKGKTLTLENITSYTYTNKDGELEEKQGEWEIKYCPACGKMLKVIRRKEDYSNDYLLRDRKKET